MPVSESGMYEKKLFVITKSLMNRVSVYQKKYAKNLNISQIVRAALDKFLRERGC